MRRFFAILSVLPLVTLCAQDVDPGAATNGFADFEQMALQIYKKSKEIVEKSDPGDATILQCPSNVSPKFTDSAANQEVDCPLKWIAPTLKEIDSKNGFRKFEDGETKLSIFPKVDLNHDKTLSKIGVNTPEQFRIFVKQMFSLTAVDFVKKVDDSGISGVPFDEIVKMGIRMTATTAGDAPEFYIWEGTRGIWVSSRKEIRRHTKIMYLLSCFTDEMKLYTIILTTDLTAPGSTDYVHYLSPW